MTGMMNAITVIALFIGLKAVVGSFFSTRLFDTKATVCVIVGSIIGAFISTPLSVMSTEAGYIGIGIGIGLVYILAYTGIFRMLINLIPARVKRLFRSIFRVIGIAFSVVLIIGVSFLVLHLLA